MTEEEMKRIYNAALEQLAEAMNLKPAEVSRFCGDIEKGDWGARRLKEFFKNPNVVGILDRVIELSENYRQIYGSDAVKDKA